MSPIWVRAGNRVWHLSNDSAVATIGVTRCGQSVAVQAVASPALLPNMMGKVCEECRAMTEEQP